MSIFDSIFDIVILFFILCHFRRNVIKLCITLSKLDLPSLRPCSAEGLVSSPTRCQIFYLFCCALSSLLPWRSVGRSTFICGLHNLITLIGKRHEKEDKITIYIYIARIHKRNVNVGHYIM